MDYVKLLQRVGDRVVLFWTSKNQEKRRKPRKKEDEMKEMKRRKEEREKGRPCSFILNK